MARPKLKVRRVLSTDDRKRPSVFMRLKTKESFVGYALFEPDPTPSDENPGYFEYMDHYDQTANQYVPCAGEDCPFCRVNDNPSTRALTVWYFPDNDAGDKIKVFTMNYGTTEDVADIAEEEEGIFGKKFRVKRISDRGEYRVRPMSDKPLSKTEIKKLLADIPNLEELVERQLKIQWERLKATEMLEDTDEDEDEDEEEEVEKPKARKGKVKEEEPEEDEDEDEEEEEEDEDDDEDEDEEEEDDDDSDDDEDEEESEDEDEEDENTLTAVEMTVVSTNEDNETVTGKVGKDTYEVWLSDGMELDFDTVKKGTKLVVSAIQDDEGDWVASDIEVVSAKPGKGKSKTKK